MGHDVSCMYPFYFRFPSQMECPSWPAAPLHLGLHQEDEGWTEAGGEHLWAGWTRGSPTHPAAEVAPFGGEVWEIFILRKIKPRFKVKRWILVLNCLESRYDSRYNETYCMYKTDKTWRPNYHVKLDQSSKYPFIWPGGTPHTYSGCTGHIKPIHSELKWPYMDMGHTLRHLFILDWYFARTGQENLFILAWSDHIWT